MRSLPIRNVLRGLIAASLLAVGSNVSYGLSAVRHYSLSHACFLNDFDSDSHLGLHRNHGQEPLLTAIGMDALDNINEIHECERSAALHDARSHVNAFLNHRVPRITNELLLGFRTGFSWVGLVAKTRNSIISQWNGTFLKLADTVGHSPSTELESLAVGIQGNIFVYRFEDESNGAASVVDGTETPSVPNQLAVAELHPDDGAVIVEDNSYLEEINVLHSPATDASEEIAESEEVAESTVASNDVRTWEGPARPPILEGDSTPAVAASSSTDLGNCGLGSCGLGSCEAVSSEKEHDLLSDVPNHLANVERLPIDEPALPRAEYSLVYDRSVIDSWTATDWNVKHWYFKSQSHTSTGLFYSSPHKRMYPDLAMASGSSITGILDHIPLDPALYPDKNPILSPETDIIELPSSTTVYTPGPWFSDLIASTTDFATSQWKLWRPTMEQSRKQTNRITANQLRNIGMFFLKSASQFDTTGFEAEVAGRDQTQR